MTKKTLKELFYDKKFYKMVLFLALPIILQNLIASSVNMLDTLMIGRVGEVELAAVGIANQFYFIFSLFIMGISSGCAVFIAQLWGKRDKNNIQKVLGIGIISSVLITTVFNLVGVLFPEKIISIFNIDPQVIKIGSSYLKIVCFSYIFTAISFNYAAALRSVENTVLPMIASFLGLVVNGVLNTVLIFGLLGFPAMGVRGAAIATIIARGSECALLVLYTYTSKNILAAKAKDLFNITRELTKSVFVTMIPVLLNEACWGLGNLTYAVIYGRIGTQATASIQICTTIFNLFMIITFGLANVAVVVIGKEIGAGREKRGLLYARRLCVVSLITGVILAVVLAITSPIVLTVFKVSEEVLRNSLRILYVYSALMPLRVFTVILVVGILRGGGDAKYGAIVQGITLWGIGIPLSFVAAFILHLPIYLVVSVTAAEEIVKCIIVVRRYRSNKWINNIVNEVSKESIEIAI
ncbi:multidrug transporter MatE [Clostridium sulfidigenes]|uniref:Multidrug transporter MatE n=1 Tax=Clostridium sulfidigenes TaxID=318464 RepID=A0A084JII5_9CLOT|nr:MATE family efflux transporter [Clostridium sulfidigenes]KEZ88769.1 multidrug transporter MatE [Clostridium sulfidigenes]HCO73637.1 MATE family efflux transporter [Clostridium sp.]